MAITRLETIIAEWNAQARARGNFPTRCPSGPDVGLLCERTPSGEYLPAPDAVRQAEAAMVAQEQEDIEDWRKLQMYQDALRTGTAWVLGLPRRIVADVVGVPPWIITAIVVGGLGWIVYRMVDAQTRRA